ncbi:MAG: helix-turn-helix domain-containing protein [Pseudomonadota bacterium]
MEMDIPKPQLLSIDEAAIVLRLSRATLYRLQKTDPTFPKMIKVGRSSRFRLKDLEAFVAAAPNDIARSTRVKETSR